MEIKTKAVTAESVNFCVDGFMQPGDSFLQPVARFQTHPNTPKPELNCNIPELSGQRLSWQNRSLEHWQKLVTQDEAMRLLLTAADSNQDNWVDEWELRTPYKLYWPNDPTVLAKKRAGLYGAKTTNDLIRSQQLAEAIQPHITSQWIAISMLIRKIDAQRMKDRSHGSKLELGLYEQAAQAAHLSSDQLADFQNRYRSIVEAFWPFAQMLARNNTRCSGIDSEDREGYAGMRMSAAVLRFYWEPYLINPQLTVSRFFPAIGKAIQYPDVKIARAKGVEVSTEALTDLPAANSVASEVTGKLGRDQIGESMEGFARKLAERATAHPQTRQQLVEAVSTILHLRIYEGLSYPKIVQAFAKAKRINHRTVAEVVSGFGRYLRQTTDLPLAPSDGGKERTQPFWDNLFENIEIYKHKYDRYRMKFIPALRVLVDTFFANQTGERDSTLDALEPLVPSFSRSSIRRNIAKVINTLDHKEDGGAKRSWTREQDRLLMWQQMQSQSPAWQMLTPDRQALVRRYYFDDPEQGVTNRQIATELGVHECTISRELDRIRRHFLTVH